MDYLSALAVWSGIQSTKAVFLSRKPREESDQLLIKSRYNINKLSAKHPISENKELEKCFLHSVRLSYYGCPVDVGRANGKRKNSSKWSGEWRQFHGELVSRNSDQFVSSLRIFITNSNAQVMRITGRLPPLGNSKMSVT